VAAERLRGRGGDKDRYEQLDMAFHRRVRAGFRAIVAAAPKRCVLLDASADAACVHTAVMTALRTRGLLADQ
jgi:dTMP kinase